MTPDEAHRKRVQVAHMAKDALDQLKEMQKRQTFPPHVFFTDWPTDETGVTQAGRDILERMGERGYCPKP